MRYADHYAKIRLQELKCRSSVTHGSGNVLGMGAGYTFTPIGPMEKKKHLTIKMHLHLKLPNYHSNEDFEESLRTECRFEAIPYDVPYHAERVTRKPLIAGLQTAVVVGPSGWDNVKSGPFTDSKIGNVRVQFRWDRRHTDGRDDKQNVTSSIPVRISQIAARNGSGAMFIPLVGDEVLVAFEEGDPDRPVIVGSLYNMMNLPPLDVQNHKMVSYISDVASNAVVFTADPSKEQITIYANYQTSQGGNYVTYGNKTAS
jgi:type VI secretion system secreted protein VgrG